MPESKWLKQLRESVKNRTPEQQEEADRIAASLPEIPDEGSVAVVVRRPKKETKE
jgi:hypothetical protein